MVDHFAKHGLLAKDYANAAMTFPSLLTRRPIAVISHVRMLNSMQEEGLLGIPDDSRSFFAFVCSHPKFLGYSDDNLHLREIASHVTGRSLRGYNRHLIEEALRDDLSKDHPSDTDRKAGRHARCLLLNALKHEGYLKAK